MTEQRPVIGRQGARPKGVARRREILDRAIDVFRERGSQGTSLRRIAESLGISHAALLHYFDSREQLLVAVYAHAEATRGGAERRDVREGTESMIDSAIGNLEVPGLVELYTTLVATALETDSPAAKEHFTTRFERLRSSMTASLLDQQRAGLVRDDVPADHLAALIIAASDGLQIQWLLEPSVELEATLRTLDALIHPVSGAPNAPAAQQRSARP